MRGLDPRIHADQPLIDVYQQSYRSWTAAWIAGSSPAMTI
jgi:hypothetical protein